VNDGLSVSDGYVNVDARKNVAYGLVMNVRGAEKRIRSPRVYREAEIGVRDLVPDRTRIALKCRTDRCVWYDLFYDDRRRYMPKRRGRHWNAVPTDRKLQRRVNIGENNQDLTTPIIEIVALQIQDSHAGKLDEPTLLRDAAWPGLVDGKRCGRDEPILTRK